MKRESSGAAQLMGFLDRARMDAGKPFRVTGCRSRHLARRFRALLHVRRNELSFNVPRIADVIGFDEQAAFEVEEFEVAWMKRLESLQRFPRESDLQEIAVSARQDVDEAAPPAHTARAHIPTIDADGHGAFYEVGASRSSNLIEARCAYARARGPPYPLARRCQDFGSTITRYHVRHQPQRVNVGTPATRHRHDD